MPSGTGSAARRVLVEIFLRIGGAYPFITELNIAWNTGESFVNIFGGLWLADFVGSYLEAGGDALYYFHYLPVGSTTAATVRWEHLVCSR